MIGTERTFEHGVSPLPPWEKGSREIDCKAIGGFGRVKKRDMAAMVRKAPTLFSLKMIGEATHEHIG